MSEWIICIACGLKHGARPDGACPRCRTRLSPQLGAATPPPAPPAFASAALVRPAPPPPYPAPPEAELPSRRPATEGSARFNLPELTPLEDFPLGSRIAGWVLFANVLTSVASAIAVAAARERSVSLAEVAIPAAVDLTVGTLLVAGREKARWWALARVILGAAIHTPILWSSAGPALAIPQLALCLGLLLLLLGRPGPLRIGLGIAAASAALVVALAITASPLAATGRG